MNALEVALGKKKFKSPEIPKFEMPTFFFNHTDVELIRKQNYKAELMH